MGIMRRKMVLLIDIFVERALKASHPMLTHILHNLRTDEKTVFLALKNDFKRHESLEQQQKL